jgi:hypothetical protein
VTAGPSALHVLYSKAAKPARPAQAVAGPAKGPRQPWRRSCPRTRGRSIGGTAPDERQPARFEQ